MLDPPTAANYGAEFAAMYYIGQDLIKYLLSAR